MNTYLLWHNGRCLASFRHTPGQHIWRWFEQVRQDSSHLKPEGFYLQVVPRDVFPDAEVGFPKLAHWRWLEHKGRAFLIPEPRIAERQDF